MLLYAEVTNLTQEKQPLTNTVLKVYEQGASTYA